MTYIVSGGALNFTHSSPRLPLFETFILQCWRPCVWAFAALVSANLVSWLSVLTTNEGVYLVVALYWVVYFSCTIYFLSASVKRLAVKSKSPSSRPELCSVYSLTPVHSRHCCCQLKPWAPALLHSEAHCDWWCDVQLSPTQLWVWAVWHCLYGELERPVRSTSLYASVDWLNTSLVIECSEQCSEWYLLFCTLQIGVASGKLKRFIIEPFVTHKQVAFC